MYIVPVWCRCVAVQTLLVCVECTQVSTPSVAAVNTGSLTEEVAEKRKDIFKACDLISPASCRGNDVGR